jgi:hypothetical protein
LDAPGYVVGAILGGGRCWSRLRRWGVDAGAHQQKQVDEKDGDENEAADEDVRFESEHGFVAGKVGGRDVFVLVVAFVVVFVHADQLTWQTRLRAAWGRNILLLRE